MKQPIRIAFCAEGNYIPHAAAMLDSLVVSNPGESFELYVLEGPGSDSPDRERLLAWLAEKGLSIRPVGIPAGETLGSAQWSPAFPRSVWYRVLLPDLLPEIPRILYLDVDTLVVDRIRPLWETDLRGHLFAAVVNPLYRFMTNWPVEHLGVPSRGHYLNSGVLLLDLERMRQERCIEAVRSFLSSPGTAAGHVVHDQDALAALFHSRCLFLHPRWNVQTTYYELSLRHLPVDRQQVLEARRNPAIVHFIGPWKPSHFVCRHPYRDAYLRHRRATPWPLAKPGGRTLRNFVMRHLSLQWIWRLLRLRDFLRRLLNIKPATTATDIPPPLPEPSSRR